MSQTAQTAPAIPPMMQQYLDIKEAAGAETILFYRMGDFYEMFFNDAERAAPALDIVLTKRGKHQGQVIPMCGVPVHSAEHYIQALTRKGFAVAICEITGRADLTKNRADRQILPREILRVVASCPDEAPRNEYTTEPDHRTAKCLWERVLLNGKLVAIMESEVSAKKFIGYLEDREIYSLVDWISKAEPHAKGAYNWQTRSGGVCEQSPFRHEADYSRAED